jgi:hypothetical protein
MTATVQATNQLCWDHPDLSSDMHMPNAFRGINERMRSEHPKWFIDETD